MTAPMRSRDMMQVEGVKRTKERPKVTWVEGIRSDMSAFDLTEDITLEWNGGTGFV